MRCAHHLQLGFCVAAHAGRQIIREVEVLLRGVPRQHERLPRVSPAAAGSRGCLASSRLSLVVPDGKAWVHISDCVNEELMTLLLVLLSRRSDSRRVLAWKSSPMHATRATIETATQNTEVDGDCLRTVQRCTGPRPPR